ncbi:MAG TPA: hypothetical protein VMJ65_01690 [Solirubrobacteraceae bacterium]|nr:hypothetical protein [Solirubrobacteraceae bacterium]
MSPPSSALRTLAFGDVVGTVWGTAWVPESNGPAVGAVGGDSALPVVSSLRVSVSDDGAQWRLDGNGVALIASPAGEIADAHTPDEDIVGFDQLCRVTGTFEQGGSDRAVDCLGVRTSRSGAFDLAKLESVRAVSTWFEPDEGFALTAFRARKAKHHDSDVLTATVLGPEQYPSVEDSRLSTTYDADGWPIRAGLELWLAAAEGDEEQFPRRASGEAAGARAETAAGELDLRAERFRWHSRGREGTGIYLLARHR